MEPGEPVADHAGGSTVLEADVEQIERGDAAWVRGERALAVRNWRGLLGRTGSVADAVDVMLRVRLLPVSGNLGPLWLERPLDNAMGRCADLAYGDPGAGPDTPAAWCRVAMADYDLWMPTIAGADPTRVPADLATLAGWAPADQRIAAAAGRAAASGLNPFPGSWVLGWGLSVAPGSGAGVGLHFMHPDLGFRGDRLGLDGAVDTLGGFALGASFSQRSSHLALVARATGANLRGAVWGDDDAAAVYAWQTAQVAAGFSSTLGRLVLAGGGEGRWDHASVGLIDRPPNTGGGFALGPWASLRWSGPLDVRVGGEVNGTQAGAGFALGSASVRGAIVGRGEHADRAGQAVARVLGEVSTDGPFFRLPSAGGSTLLRGAPSGRFRGPLLAGAQVEYRHVIYGPVGGVAFVDGAWVSDRAPSPFRDDAHVSFGAGVRLVLPPADLNTTRIDVGVVPAFDGTVTWGVVVAWGEAF